MPRHRKFEKLGHRYDKRRVKWQPPPEPTPGYDGMVKRILKDKVRRDLIETYRETKTEKL